MRDLNEASALEAVDRIINRGGDAAEVVDAVVAVLRQRGFEAAAEAGRVRVSGSDRFAERVATLISPYVGGR